MMSSLVRCAVVAGLLTAATAAADTIVTRTLKIRTSPATGVARFITSPDGGALRLPGAPADDMAVLGALGDAFGIDDPGKQLRRESHAADALGHTRTTYTQVHGGLPVFAAVLRIHRDAAGRVIAVNGTFIPDLQVDPTPALTADEARTAALAAMRAEHGAHHAFGVIDTTLTVFRTNLARGIPGTNHLAYEVVVFDGDHIRDRVFVDAHKGAVLERIPTVCELDRRMYDGGTGGGDLVWSEGDSTPFGDPDIDNLIDFSEDAFNLYASATDGTYLSFDGTDGTMHGAINNVGNCPNANWNGFSTNYCAGVTPDDVVAHEWTHAYTEYTSGLIYAWQPGALNESYSDIMGEVVDVLNGAGTDTPAASRLDGECSTLGSSIPPSFTVTAPGAVAGGYFVAGANFNPAPPAGASASIQYVDDGDDQGGTASTTDGCQPFVGFTAGRIAMVDRGNCPFVTKVGNAVAAGAVGVLVVNNQGDSVSSMGGSGPLSIPSVIIGQSDGDLLKANLTGLSGTIMLQQADVATYRWLVGEDSSSFGSAIRDMWNPTCFGDAGKVSDLHYFCAATDSGGVHSNSGVPNHAFALLVDGGSYNGRNIAALGMTKAFHIYWRAQSIYQVPTTDFADHADALEQACADLLGVNLFTISTDSSSGVLSGQILTAADCVEVADAIAAVEFRTAPTQCGFQPILQADAPAPCPVNLGAASVYEQDWEAGLGAWTVGTRDVVDPGTFDTPDWAVVSALPDGRPGSAAFVADLVIGNCSDDLESGVLFLESPTIALPVGSAPLRVTFDHWVATEAQWDGGNVKINVNGAGWTLIPGSAFTFNAYPAVLNSSDNPMGGEEAFTGTDGGAIDGSWGQSHIDLTGLAGSTDDIQLRFEMGLDGCNGITGWYVDAVRVVECINCIDGDGDGYGNPGSIDCPNGAAEDCRDDLASAFPGAPETPDDGIDQDCNGFDSVSCFLDGDNDGVGGATVVVATDGDCTDPGESAITGDCADNDNANFPGNTEVCDGQDNDCSGAEDCSRHGNVVGPPCVVDLLDVVYVIDAFSDAAPALNFPGSDLIPCGGGDGVVTIDDVLSALDAFAGSPHCPDTCP